MPSKQFLQQIDEHKVTNCLEYAVKNLGVKKVLKSITYMADGQIRMVLETNDGTQFVGVGMTKSEAVAEALSMEFPVNLYPNKPL
jgi:hypothetical protein